MRFTQLLVKLKQLLVNSDVTQDFELLQDEKERISKRSSVYW
ncbi:MULTISPECIES: hypothetical protein [unclassified Peribacillus]|nr:MULTISPECIES: hypothetical protein [unclassified Peribacillus]